MGLEKQMLITLTDNKEYIVLDTIKYDNIKYVYLVSRARNKNIKFCIEEIENGHIKLTEVEDMKLRQQLLLLFTRKLQKDNS